MRNDSTLWPSSTSRCIDDHRRVITMDSDVIRARWRLFRSQTGLVTVNIDPPGLISGIRAVGAICDKALIPLLTNDHRWCSIAQHNAELGRRQSPVERHEQCPQSDARKEHSYILGPVAHEHRDAIPAFHAERVPQEIKPSIGNLIELGIRPALAGLSIDQSHSVRRISAPPANRVAVSRSQWCPCSIST